MGADRLGLRHPQQIGRTSNAQQIDQHLKIIIWDRRWPLISEVCPLEVSATLFGLLPADQIYRALPGGLAVFDKGF